MSRVGLCICLLLLTVCFGCGKNPPQNTRPLSQPPPKPPSVAPAPAPLGGTTYVVKPADTFFGIARKVYGDGALWRVVQDANRDRLKDGHLLTVGQELLIPPKPEGASP